MWVAEAIGIQEAFSDQPPTEEEKIQGPSRRMSPASSAFDTHHVRVC